MTAHLVQKGDGPSSRDPRTFFDHAAAYFRSRSTVTPTEWAARDRYVTGGDFDGARWAWDVTPYLQEIADFAANPTARRAVVLKSTRVGYTQGVLLNILGWSVVEDRCPMMVMLPTDDMATRFANTQFLDFCTGNRVVQDVFGGAPADIRGGRHQRGRSKNLIRFPGGKLETLGAKDPNFRGNPFRRVLADEIDDWFVRRSTAEGDPIERLCRRTDDYHDGFVIAGSSPRVTETSRVWALWERSDQRKWFVPCPECGEFQVIEWERIEWPKRVTCCGTVGKWGEPCGSCGISGAPKSRVKHIPEGAWYRCAACEAPIPESRKAQMVRRGEWRPTGKGRFPGWHVTALFSLINNARWEIIVRKYLEAKAQLRRGNDELMRVWKQTLIGLPWDETRRVSDAEALEDRAETYGTSADGSVLEVPPGVGVLTAGVDVHGKWSEVLVRGWGVGAESWDVAHQRVVGSPATPELWAGIDAVLMREWKATGRALRIQIALVDSGDFSEEVYRYCTKRLAIYPSKGDAGYTGRPLAKLSTGKAQAVQLVNVGTWTGKNQLMHRLGLKLPGPGYIHLRAPDRRVCNGFDREYFAQFRAEELRTTPSTAGGRRMRWHQVRERNESIDLHVLAAAAFSLLGPSDADLDRLAAAAESAKDSESVSRVPRPGTVHPGYGPKGERLR